MLSVFVQVCVSLTFVGLVCYVTLICEDAVGFEHTFAVMIVIRF